ncbi:uncharacterized protein LOC117226622 [Megalopta genalis]|uniref:uncharacterized protein LOC117226622 n=1 Tax=Megalopta genalis TaxID=115081 RepID=UPI003FD1A989
MFLQIGLENCDRDNFNIAQRSTEEEGLLIAAHRYPFYRDKHRNRTYRRCRRFASRKGSKEGGAMGPSRRSHSRSRRNQRRREYGSAQGLLLHGKRTIVEPNAKEPRTLPARDLRTLIPIGGEWKIVSSTFKREAYFS